MKVLSCYWALVNLCIFCQVELSVCVVNFSSWPLDAATTFLLSSLIVTLDTKTCHRLLIKIHFTV